MSIQSSANNYFRTASHVGIRQKVGRKRAFDLPGGILLWKAVAKVLLWSMPVVLGMNLLFSSVIESQGRRVEALEQSLAAIEESNIQLRTEKASLTSPANVKIAAAGKLSLYEPKPGQIRRM